MSKKRLSKSSPPCDRRDGACRSASGHTVHATSPPYACSCFGSSRTVGDGNFGARAQHLDEATVIHRCKPIRRDVELAGFEHPARRGHYVDRVACCVEHRAKRSLGPAARPAACARERGDIDARSASHLANRCACCALLSREDGVQICSDR
eukprot:6524954-Prymnesium_polylepis.1